MKDKVEKTEDKTVVRWFNRLAPGSVHSFGKNFSAFMVWMKENGEEFAGMSPDDLVNYMKKASGEDQYKLLDKIQEHIESLKEMRHWTLKSKYTAIRSFFAHNRAALPEDPSFQMRADVPPVKATLTIDEVKEIVLTSTPVYSAIILSMFQSGMGSEEFEFWNLHGLDSLKNDLEKDASFFTVDLPGRKKQKNKKPYSTFIDGDAKEAIIEYLPYRNRARKTFERLEKLRRYWPEWKGKEYIERKFEPNVIFYNNFGKPIKKRNLRHYWFRRTVKLGLIKPIGDSNPRNRYGKHVHEMRSLFRSQWEKSPAKESVGEYMMGHTVDPLEYNKAFKDTKWVHGELRKALPFLNIMSSPRPFGLVDKDEFTSDYEQLAEDLRKANLRIAELENNDNSKIDSVKKEMLELKRQLKEMADNMKK